MHTFNDVEAGVFLDARHVADLREVIERVAFVVETETGPVAVGVTLEQHVVDLLDHLALVDLNACCEEVRELSKSLRLTSSFSDGSPAGKITWTLNCW